MNKLFINDELVTDLNDKVINLVLYFKSHKIHPRKIIALYISDNLQFIIAYEACRACSLIPLVLRQPMDLNSLKILGASYLCFFDREFKLQELEQPINFIIPGDLAIICQTSGTTNLPKCVPWTYQSIDYQSNSTFATMKYEKNDRLMTNLPLTSSYGLSLIHIWQRFPITLILCDSFYPNKIIDLAKNIKATCFDSVPQMYFGLYRKIKHSSKLDDLTSIRLWCCGSDYLSLDLSRQWLETMNKPLLDGYGLTEAGPNVSLNTLENYRLGTVGKPLPQTSIRFSSTAELLVTSPSCIKNYWSSSEINYQHDSWLQTGDICEIDKDGYLIIKGRVKNKIVVNGTTIFAEEVESALLKHFSIQTVVTSVKTKSGDKLGLLVVKDDDLNFNKMQINNFCKTFIPGNITPKSLHFISSIPLSLSGKIDRVKVQQIMNQNLRDKLGEL